MAPFVRSRRFSASIMKASKRNAIAMRVTTAKWTIDEYHRMIAAGILEDRRVELLQGEIVEMSPEGEPTPTSVVKLGNI
jgi:Uma2 family endonuclease